MSVILAVALIFCMVVPSYAIVAEGVLIYGGITISAAAIKTLLVWSGITIGAVAVTGVAVDNADKIAYTASAIWDDVKQSATTAAQTVKDWVTSWTSTSTEADNTAYTTPVTKTWTAAEIQAVVDAFREYLSLSTTTSTTGEKILNIRTLKATYTVTASKTYVQGDTCFTVSDGNEFYVYPVNTNFQQTDVSSEAVLQEAVDNFVTAMTNKGIQVVEIPVSNVSGTKLLDVLKVRTSEPSKWDVLYSSGATTSDYTTIQLDNVWNTSDGKKVINCFPFMFQTKSKYPEVYLRSNPLDGETALTVDSNEGFRLSQNTGFGTDSIYVAVVPYIAYGTANATKSIRMTADGYASLLLLTLRTCIVNGRYQINWCPMQFTGTAYESQTTSFGYTRNMAGSVPIDCDITIMTELGTLVNADEVRKEVPIVGIEDGVTVPADVLTGDVSITLPTTSDVTLGDTLVNDMTTAGTLADAGVKTDSLAIDTATTADPSVPGGGGSGGVAFPTGVFDGIWKYVVHLVEKGSAFIGFLGDCLSCIPQEVSWCFYGGLVLLIFGAVLSKMLL